MTLQSQVVSIINKTRYQTPLQARAWPRGPV